MKNKVQVSVNARFMTVNRKTGVQYWATNFTEQLLQDPRFKVQIIKPRNLFSSGLPGYFWEQIILPFRSRNTTLISPCNTGSIFFKNQLICVHDALIFTHQEYFKIIYSKANKILLWILIRRTKGFITVSRNSEIELKTVYPNLIAKITYVGMGLRSFPKEVSTEHKSDSYFLFIGGDIARKNLDFLLNFWPRIFRESNTKLYITTSQEFKTLLRTTPRRVEGCIYIDNPDDASLSILYQKSIALLWPSKGEGFGMPLLEIMSHGKPFISTPVGAAKELAVGKSRVLPLDENSWITEIKKLVSEGEIYDEIQVNKASNYNWQSVAESFHALLLRTEFPNLK